MSTIVQITISQELFANDLMPIYKLFEQIENTCSRFRDDSELSHLNQQIEKEVKVSSEFFSILKTAEEFYFYTDGIFHPGILSSIENSGYSKSIESIRGQELDIPLSTATAVVQSLPFLLKDEGQTVILFSKIDLGGIAKGWVIDRAAEMLELLGFGFINVGGDIRIFGTLPRPLNIGIEDPFDPAKMISSIQVKSGALATSSSLKRSWLVKGKLQHHLIDPRTGKPSESTIVSATVTAPTAVEADVWAKTTLLLGEEKGHDFIIQTGSRSVVINKTKEIWRGGE